MPWITFQGKQYYVKNRHLTPPPRVSDGPGVADLAYDSSVKSFNEYLAGTDNDWTYEPDIKAGQPDNPKLFIPPAWGHSPAGAAWLDAQVGGGLLGGGGFAPHIGNTHTKEQMLARAKNNPTFYMTKEGFYDENDDKEYIPVPGLPDRYSPREYAYAIATRQKITPEERNRYKRVGPDLREKDVAPGAVGPGGELVGALTRPVTTPAGPMAARSVTAPRMMPDAVPQSNPLVTAMRRPVRTPGSNAPAYAPAMVAPPARPARSDLVAAGTPAAARPPSAYSSVAAGYTPTSGSTRLPGTYTAATPRPASPYPLAGPSATRPREVIGTYKPNYSLVDDNPLLKSLRGGAYSRLFS